MAAAAVSLLSGILLQGTFGHWVIVLAAGLWLGIPLAVFMGLWLVFALKRTGKIPAGLRTTFFLAVLIIGSLLLSLGAGTAVRHWEIRKARAYVAGVVPLLEAYRERHGGYPKTLAPLGLSAPPRLLRNSHGYSAEADHFRFEYWDPGGMMDGYAFDSSSRQWTRFD